MGIELATAALNLLGKHPVLYNAAIWITEEQTDLAGRIVLQAGAEPLFGAAGKTGAYRVEYRGEVHTVPVLARRLLDITESEAARLFSPRNSLDQLAYMVTELELDRMMLREDMCPAVTCEEVWTTSAGVKHMWRHRSTTVITAGKGREVRHHHSRDEAHDYITDVAACREGLYRHHNDIWSYAA